MKIKLSKKQWEMLGKQAGWDKNVKTAQMQNGQSKLGQEVAQKLNFYISRMGRPDLESNARALASQLVALFDQAEKQTQGM